MPPRAYFGAMRSAPSSRMVSPLSIGFSTMCTASAPNSSGSRRGGAGAARSRRARRGPPRGSAASSGVSNRPGAIVHDADLLAAEVARGGQRHPDDSALGGGVGDLADLPVVRGDRRRVDADATIAVERLVREHRGRRDAQHVEGPDEVDVDDDLERLERVGAVLGGRALGPADAGAVDRDPQRPGLGGGGDGGPRSVSGLVTSISTNCARLAELGDQRVALLRVEVGDGDVGAGGVQAPGGGGAETGGSARDECAGCLRSSWAAEPTAP